jgi:hypothetical protein
LQFHLLISKKELEKIYRDPGPKPKQSLRP